MYFYIKKQKSMQRIIITCLLLVFSIATYAAKGTELKITVKELPGSSCDFS
jgi:hypothetical protein